MFTRTLCNAMSLLSETVPDVSAGGLASGDGTLSPAEKPRPVAAESGSFSVPKRGLAGMTTPSGVRENTAER